MFKKKLVQQYFSEISSTEESDVSTIFQDNKWVKPMSTSSSSGSDTEIEYVHYYFLHKITQK